MFGINLAVYQLNTIIFQMLNKFYKSIFACITLFAKHTFTKKYFSNSYSIKTTNQFAIFPDLGAVNKAKFVQNRIGFFYLIGDPCACLTFSPDRFAITNNLDKSFISGKIECILVKQFFHALAHF